MKLYDIPNSLIISVVDEWVQGERNREIIKDRYINQMCYEPLAEKYELSVTTVRSIVKKYEPIFFKHLDEAVKKQKLAENCHFFDGFLILN